MLDFLKRSHENLDGVIDKISLLPQDWHGAGQVHANTLRVILKHARRIGRIRHTAETGSGITTLFFSHLSEHHVTFSLDSGRSISNVRSCPLFRADRVTFIEGPSQFTLPAYRFEQKLQIALLDGPHGYPFPDLEYFYFYPQMEPGGLLLVDDIKIPSVGRMFEILKKESMFRVLEVAYENLALLQRTDAPLSDPTADNWWLQGYNAPYYAEIMSAASA
jgi:hypothetical protein